MIAKYWFLLHFSMALMATAVPASAISCPFHLPTSILTLNGQELVVELAYTPETRACGLSHRKTLKENAGMLFLFKDMRSRSFWMRDTHIPLSIAFMDESGKIVQMHQMAPDQTRTTYPSFRPVKFALEVNQGWFDRHAVKLGDTVKINLPSILNIK